MFWTRRNHCGVFEGQALRESEAPDRDGRLAIPDGDFDYGVSIFGAAGFVFDQESVFYQRIVKLDGPITTVPVHRLDRRTVTVEITDGSRPIAGAQIVGVDRYTGCMDSGLRPLGAT